MTPLPPWMINELKREQEKREQDEQRPVLQIELPPEEEDKETEKKPKEEWIDMR